MKNGRKFSEYARFFGENVLECRIDEDFEVKSVAANSKFAEKNSLFCAVKGVNVDGNDFVSHALEQGASGVISSDKNYGCMNFLQVADDRLAYSEAQRFFYGEPDRRLKFLGVTGTNGKTTTVYLFFHLLSKLGVKSALFSTVENFDGVELKSSSCTTPEAGELFLFSSRAEANGAEYLLFECSSHALSQKRFGNAQFQAAIFTNLTGDHLDYHQNLENYFAAKKILFCKNLAPDGAAVINIDDRAGNELALELRQNGRNVVTFGFNGNADMQMSMIDGKFFLNGFQVESSLIGRHNFYNITGVLCVLQFFGYELEKCLEILKNNIINVPGRLEKIELGKHGTAFVDYAHTDDALQNVLAILKQEALLRKGRVICVFGCGGDRDRTKRPRMGKVASLLADEFILTSDNPRSEDPCSIINEILQGCERKPLAVESDRAEAIRIAVNAARSNDIVLVAGKGHEKEQVIGSEKHYFDDCEVLKKYIENGDGE